MRLCCWCLGLRAPPEVYPPARVAHKCGYIARLCAARTAWVSLPYTEPTADTFARIHRSRPNRKHRTYDALTCLLYKRSHFEIMVGRQERGRPSEKSWNESRSQYSPTAHAHTRRRTTYGRTHILGGTETRPGASSTSRCHRALRNVVKSRRRPCDRRASLFLCLVAGASASVCGLEFVALCRIRLPTSRLSSVSGSVYHDRRTSARTLCSVTAP